jgi:predicted ribosomally synthesized peptide with SipW-like signal peptide
MNNKKATKRALLTSVMALVMCVVMLVGTTFAWFTDTASTGVNKIVAGNLDVDIIGETSNDHVTTLNFTKANAATDAGATEAVLWEPGCRYLTQGFRIANKGNLALKWKAVVNKGTTAKNPGKFDLLDVIDFYLVKGDKNSEGTLLDEFTGTLQKNETSDVYYIKGVMKTTAGNDYQGLTLDGITITVYATQLTAEFDSFDNQYDKDAKYTEVIAGGKTFEGKATLSTGITATDPDAVAVRATGTAADVTILDGTFDGGSGGNNVCVWAGNGAKVTIKDGTFTVGGDADGFGNSVIESNGGNIVIEGGFFYTNYNYNGKYYVLNQKNDNPGTITVKGGTFVNYDPSKGDDNLGGSFVPDGYSVISEKHGEDTWYTVVKGTGATAGTQTELDNAITNNETSTVKLTTAGTYTLPDELQGKDITVIGTKDTVVNMANNDCYHADNVSLEGVTVEFANEDYRGFKHTGKLTYKDCTITGKQFLYGTEVEFINCTFVQDAVDYNVWTYGAGSVLFKDCTFDCKGKAVLIYNEGHISSQNVEFQNCKFKASAPVNGKAAIEIDCTYTSYNVVIDKATADNVTGFAAGSVSGSPVWNVKLGSKPTTVTLNGTQVYPTV